MAKKLSAICLMILFLATVAWAAGGTTSGSGSGDDGPVTVTLLQRDEPVYYGDFNPSSTV